MPYRIENRNGLFRLVTPDGKIAKTKNNRAIDSGGHRSHAAAAAQARVIMAKEKLRRRKKR